MRTRKPNSIISLFLCAGMAGASGLYVLEGWQQGQWLRMLVAGVAFVLFCFLIAEMSRKMSGSRANKSRVPEQPHSESK